MCCCLRAFVVAMFSKNQSAYTRNLLVHLFRGVTQILLKVEVKIVLLRHFNDVII